MDLYVVYKTPDVKAQIVPCKRVDVRTIGMKLTLVLQLKLGVVPFHVINFTDLVVFSDKLAADLYLELFT